VFYAGPLSPVNSKAPNLESRLIELEFENERLKKQLASTIEPQELQRIKDALEDMEQSKKSYEVNFRGRVEYLQHFSNKAFSIFMLIDFLCMELRLSTCEYD
jgi:hypothetical protein